MGGGGMGGGMGGGGGGMGGGMFSVPDSDAEADAPFQAFAVEDELRLTPKGVAKPARKAATAKPDSVTPNPSKAAARPIRSRNITPIELPIADGADPTVAWNDYFAAHADVSPQRVRETARHLMRGRQFDQVIAMIHAALRHGLPQPWMYEAMVLGMQAGGSSIQEIERALMSAIDFGESADDFMYVAQYMARIGLESRALSIFRQVSVIEPLRPEPYLFGLRLARQVDDLDGIRWSSLGILKQAWAKDKYGLVQQARRAANSAVERMNAAGQTAKAKEFQAQLDEAKRRDCIVKVTWTGNADVDMIVEEPSGNVCSFRNPRTAGGGVMLGDSASGHGQSSVDGVSETYVCPEGFDGTYRVLLRRVWGTVTAGKVTVDVYHHYGSENEKHLRHQIPLGDGDQLVVFDLDNGRRQEALDDQLLANAASEQMNVNQAILAQQLGGLANSSGGAANLNASRQGLFAVPVVQQGVGYQPVIISLPAGTSFSVTGVVSADRRYVRITPQPFFSGVSSVTTFNIQSGATSTAAGSGDAGTQPGQVPPGANPNPVP
jgi:hypothetical protein